MSYILDALKKAEAERKLGSVPDVHAQAIPASAESGHRPLKSPLLWIGLAALVTACIVLAWLQPWQAKPDLPPVLQAPQDVAKSEVDVPPSSNQGETLDQDTTARESEAKAAPDGDSQAKQNADLLARDESAAIVIAQPEKKPPPDTATAQSARKSLPTSTEQKSAALKSGNAVVAPGKAPASPPVAAPEEANIPWHRDLPPQIQREIPAVTVGGYIYSPTPADRSMLINNRLLREGEQISPGLTLEKIRLKDAVLNFKGYRYRVSY